MSPMYTLPELPSIVIASPSCTTFPSTLHCLLSKSIFKLEHPTTHGLPIPLATTAA